MHLNLALTLSFVKYSWQKLYRKHQNMTKQNFSGPSLDMKIKIYIINHQIYTNKVILVWLTNNGIGSLKI